MIRAVDARARGGAIAATALDSRLTRRRRPVVGVTQATLRFQAWYDLENQFDFVYLSASRDGGHTWQVLPAQHTVARPGDRQQLRRGLDRLERRRVGSTRRST